MQRSENNLLLIKHHDKHADSSRDIMEKETSAISWLTINDLKTGHLLKKQSHPS
jgi:hypothetical protein